MPEYYPKNGRVILHIDANAFFASVEMAENPSLQNKAVIVAGNPEERKGIVVAANYKCKEKGVYTTMALQSAIKLVPEAVVIKPNHKLYHEYSKKIFAYLTEISPVIEYASIDEAYLDITSCFRIGTPLQIAYKIQQEVQQRFNIPLSIGIAPNKFLAKMASDLQKPLGITVLRKRDIERVLWPRPVIDAHGIGQKTAEKLHEHGITTIGDLAKSEQHKVKSVLGIRGLKIWERVNGVDSRPVDPEANTSYKSIGSSSTFSKNIIETAAISARLLDLSRQVSERMKKRKAVSRTIQVTIRYHDFKTISRSQTLEYDIQEAADIHQAAEKLFFKHWTGDSVRLLGITAQNAVDKKKQTTQLDLFSYQETADKIEPLLEAVESLHRKYGHEIIKKGI